MSEQQPIDVSSNLSFLTSHPYDDRSTTNEQHAQYTTGLLAAHKEMVSRNAMLTQLLAHYIDNYDIKSAENRRYKDTLFNTFVGLFFLLTFGVFVVFIRADFSEVSISLAVSLVSVGATYIGSIFVAYEIMFKYLFPVDEEKDMIEMIRTVINNDLKLEEHIAKVPGFHETAERTGDTEQQEEASKRPGKAKKRKKKTIRLKLKS